MSAPTCGRTLLDDSPPCPLPAGHWPARPHRAHCPYGTGRWIDFGEDADSRLVEVARHSPADEPAQPTEVGIESPDCIQVIMMPSEQQLYRRWLAARDLYLYSVPSLNPDDPPTYALGIGAVQ